MRIRSLTVAVQCFGFCWPVMAVDHSAWDRTLKAWVNDIGEVDYARLKRDRKDLDDYVASLRQPAKFVNRADELAYWINAYNALVTHAVARAYPTKSVRDLGFVFSFFRRKEYDVGGVMMSLDDIEHRTIRAKFKEPRIHFALVCASISCPKLRREAYTGDRLEQQLEEQTRQYFRERRNLAIDPARNTVTLNAILGYYKGDFGGTLASALEFAKRYASAEDQARLATMKNPKIVTRDYDWSINDLGSRARAKSLEERELATKPH